MTIASPAPKKLVVLLGAPASGKNTIASALHGLSPAFRHFRKHRGGAASLKPEEYIDISGSDFDRMESAGAFLQSHSTYGRKYGVSQLELSSCWNEGGVPIVHAGRIEHVTPLVSIEGLETVVCLLTCSRTETIGRLNQRHPADADEVAARMKVYDYTSAEIVKGFAALDAVRIPIPTSCFSPVECATMIRSVLER